MGCLTSEYAAAPRVARLRRSATARQPSLASDVNETACPAVAREASEGWWARQDSNLQPDRYERRILPENPSKTGVSRRRLFTFGRVCSRGFWRIIGGIGPLRTASWPRPHGSTFRP